MSPTARETVAQKPLGGSELRKIITDHVDHVLSESGMFTGQIAYGRCAYEVRVILQLDNPAYPGSEVTIYSKPYPDDVTQGEHGSPQLVAVKELPIVQPSSDMYLAADKLNAQVVSPDAMRVEHGLPITVQRRGQNSETIEQKILYPKDALDGQVNPNPPPVITDVTEEVRKEKGIQ